jgi:hypothetical protein
MSEKARAAQPQTRLRPVSQALRGILADGDSVVLGVDASLLDVIALATAALFLTNPSAGWLRLG